MIAGVVGSTAGRRLGMDQRVTLITLGVADLGRAIAFYRHGLGWTPSGASIEGAIAFFQLNGLGLALWPRTLLAEEARLPDDRGWGGITLAHNVGSPEEVDRIVERMVAAGGRLLKAPGARRHGMGWLLGVCGGPRRPSVGGRVQPELAARRRRDAHAAGVTAPEERGGEGGI
jgi:catechol 2,3-dioxygenase-like lactoylglutathione lyase family enzyme